MKALIILFFLFVLVTSVPPFLYSNVRPSALSKEDPSAYFQKYNANDDDIKIYFRSQANPDSSNPIDITDGSQVASFGFRANKDTLFLVHGWHNEYDSPFCNLVSKALLDTRDINVFIVDWNAIARGLYINAFLAVPDVARILGSLINNLTINSNLDLDKATIVGHSLGAHIAGLAGHALGGKVNHIVGLDPALPGFSYDDTDNRLDTTDAKFVQVIHTCSGLLGFNVDIGHADYYPNGGRNQPGCDWDIVGSCAHSRSYEYYAESLVTGGFVAVKCGSYNDFQNQICSEQKSNMGEYNIDIEASGAYYLDTNDEPPYAKHQS